MNHQQILEYLCELLNINLKNKLVSDDILDDLKKMSQEYSLNDFRLFIKDKINYERFKYLTGYQKFIAMANEFKKENKLELSEEMQIKALTYSEDLFKRVTTICDEVNLELQTRGKKIDDLDLFATFKINGLENHHIGVLKLLGSKETIFAMAIHSKMELELKIASIVHKKAMIKSYPQLANKKSSDMKVLERLKNAN